MVPQVTNIWTVKWDLEYVTEDKMHSQVSLSNEDAPILFVILERIARNGITDW